MKLKLEDLLTGLGGGIQTSIRIILVKHLGAGAKTEQNGSH